MSQTQPDAAQSIIINGETRTIPVGCSVERLLELLDMSGRRVAVAVNRAVVPRSTYSGALLRAGDQVEVLEAVGGG